MHFGLSMRSPVLYQALHVGKRLGALAFALLLPACGGGHDYYFLNDIKGQGDTVIFEFIYTCGAITIDWDGRFGELPHYSVDLVVKHDDEGKDCEENPRKVSYDVG